ncbi:hypothetical protein BG011_000707, partial [Mortierella polycephala]
MNMLDSTHGQLDDTLKALSESLILRLAEMDMSEQDGFGTDNYSLEHDPLIDGGEDMEGQAEENDVGTTVGGDDIMVSEEGIQRMEDRKVSVKKRLDKSVSDSLRDALFYDPYIMDTAQEYGFAEDQIITRDEKGRMVFYLKANYFEDWKARHQTSIGTGFLAHGVPRAYSTDVTESSSQKKKDRAGQVLQRFDCHCRGKKFELKGRQLGGKSGKTRVRLESFRTNCGAHFNAIYRPVSTSDGKPRNTYRIGYSFVHNHKLGDKNNVGTQRKSMAIKERIKAMLLRGMSIPAIMQQLTMDHASFTRFFVDGGNQRLSRDQFIAYDD